METSSIRNSQELYIYPEIPNAPSIETNIAKKALEISLDRARAENILKSLEKFKATDIYPVKHFSNQETTKTLDAWERLRQEHPNENERLTVNSDKDSIIKKGKKTLTTLVGDSFDCVAAVIAAIASSEKPWNSKVELVHAGWHPYLIVARDDREIDPLKPTLNEEAFIIDFWLQNIPEGDFGIKSTPEDINSHLAVFKFGFKILHTWNRGELSSVTN